MQTVTLEEAQSRLAEIIERLTPGQEVIIVRGEVPVAKLSGPSPETPRPVRGRGRGMLTVISEDDEHLEHFAGYMP